MKIEPIEILNTQRGVVYIIESPVECGRTLAGAKAAFEPVYVYGDIKYEVTGIECIMPGSPIQVGEKIGLTLKPILDAHNANFIKRALTPVGFVEGSAPDKMRPDVWIDPETNEVHVNAYDQ